MKPTEGFLRYLRSDRGYSECTVVGYQADLENFEAFCRSLDEELDWQAVDRDVVRLWVVSLMEQGRSPRTVKRRLSALRSFYRYMQVTGMCNGNPADLVKSPKCDKPLPVFVKEREMDRLLDDMVFNDDYLGKRNHCILLLFYTTGIRLGELVGLYVGDVDLSRRQLCVLGKRNKQRLVPFGEELSRELQAYLDLRQKLFPRGSDSLFLGKNGLPVEREEVRRVVRRYLSMVTTLKKKSPHVLRHTFATVMLNHGADIEAVKQLLGHESLSTTEIYAHATFAELKKEYEQAHPWA